MNEAYVRFHFWILEGNLWQRWLKNLLFFLPAFLIVHTIMKWQSIARHSISWPDFLSWPAIMALVLSATFAARYRHANTISS